MGLLNAFNEWKSARYENHISNMKAQNKCPDCRGRGFITYPASEYVFYSNPYNCSGCNGSGLYVDWYQYR
ncbi:methionine aminopeptidase [Bacillus sp. T33-2]|uniref:methionine aminopeptidase n=1 Tax=Bacillus sp. T33-2 TaxID=2054168 RepID=UPI000C78AE51|nr:methionine aminopeptidase [Bacillus sp. T33-2]PLR96799.1 methionine aminopeptidase [Bacillus sp. T33-2]